MVGNSEMIRSRVESLVSLNDEVQFQVLCSVANVNCSEVIGSTLVIEGVAWPHEGSNNSCFTSLVFL